MDCLYGNADAIGLIIYSSAYKNTNHLVHSENGGLIWFVTVCSALDHLSVALV